MYWFILPLALFLAIAALLRTNAKSTLGDSEVYAVVVPGSDQDKDSCYCKHMNCWFSWELLYALTTAACTINQSQ